MHIAALCRIYLPLSLSHTHKIIMEEVSYILTGETALCPVIFIL